MFIQLWQREFRGAHRRWWRQPWVPPIVLAFALMLLGDSSLTAAILIDLPVRMGSMALAWPELLLALWILWVVTEAFARDRHFERLVPIVLTPISRAEIAWAKTFASALISVAVIALVNSGPLVDADTRAFGALGFDPRVYPTEHQSAAMAGAALVHMILVPLFLATLASRVAVRIPKPNWAFGASLLIAIVMMAGVRLFHLADPILLPLCVAVAVVYASALMESRLLAFLLAFGLWLAHLNLAMENLGELRVRYYGYSLRGLQTMLQPSGIRELIAYLAGPLVMAWFLIFGHDRVFSFLILGALGFTMAMELQWSTDPDSLWGPRATLPLVILLLLIWLTRWRRWARRSFWDQMCRLE